MWFENKNWRLRGVPIGLEHLWEGGIKRRGSESAGNEGEKEGRRERKAEGGGRCV